MEFKRFGTWTDTALNSLEKNRSQLMAYGSYSGSDPHILIKSGLNGEYRLWGIRDFSDMHFPIKSRTGTLELPFPRGKILRIENVNRVIVTWDKSIKGAKRNGFALLGSGMCDIAPTLEEMAFLHFAVEVKRYNTSTGKEETECMFFDGDTLVHTTRNIVGPIRNSTEGGVGFSVQEGNRQYHYVRETDGIICRVGVSKGSWVECESERTRTINEIVKELVCTAVKKGCFDYFFCESADNPSLIFASYLKEHYNPTRVENLFPDDETQNYKITVDINDLDLVSFLFWYGRSSYAIYDIPIENYLMFIPGNEDTEYLFGNKSELSFHEAVLEDALALSGFETVYELQKHVESYRNRTREIQQRILWELFTRLTPGSEQREPGHYWMPCQSDQIPDSSFWDNRKALEKEKREEQKQKLAAKGKLKVKWQGEYKMYKLARRLYGDAIYQYHAEWLGLQSLDIFIPQLNLGIEYQGVQHYEPVDFFGGIEGLNRRQELDEKKRTLCRENGVALLEWRYDETLTCGRLLKAIELLVKYRTLPCSE